MVIANQQHNQRIQTTSKTQVYKLNTSTYQQTNSKLIILHQINKKLWNILLLQIKANKVKTTNTNNQNPKHQQHKKNNQQSKTTKFQHKQNQKNPQNTTSKPRNIQKPTISKYAIPTNQQLNQANYNIKTN